MRSESVVNKKINGGGSRNIKTWLLLCLYLCLLPGCGEKAINPEDIGELLSNTVAVEQFSRRYLLFVPDTYKRDEPASVIFAFHGTPSTAWEMQNLTNFEEHAHERGALVVYPQNIIDWNEDCDCSNSERNGVNDVLFIDNIIADLKATYSIDSTRLYAVGFSQGGLFVDNLICKRSELFAAAATVAATMSVPLSQKCLPREPRPMMLFHGTEDGVFPYAGNLNNGNNSTLSAENALSKWGEFMQCYGDPVIVDEKETFRRSVLSTCGNGAEIQLFTMKGLGHTWPKKEFDAEKRIMAFFDRFVR